MRLDDAWCAGAARGVAALEPLLQAPHACCFAAILSMLKTNVLVQPLGGMILSAHLQGELAAPQLPPFRLHPLQEEAPYPLLAVCWHDRQVVNIDERARHEGRKPDKADRNALCAWVDEAHDVARGLISAVRAVEGCLTPLSG